MQNVYNKYKQFEFKVLEYCDTNLIFKKEIEYIKKYNTYKSDIGLNLTEGGELPPRMIKEQHPFYGKKRESNTEEQKRYKSRINASFDIDSVVLIDPTGKEIYLKNYCSLYEFSRIHNISPRNLATMIKKSKIKRLTQKGWYVKGSPEKRLPKNSNYYRHLKLISADGKIVSMDKYQNIKIFSDEINLDNSTVLKLFKGKAKTTKGWRLYNG